ncbi:MAG TPA: thiamine pyrophosphate-dependent enzyme, partial [Balneolaceae bacterium]|nr:thiamine pyrophosphate-dependent enzyme [Balneolaceae bacterium]
MSSREKKDLKAKIDWEQVASLMLSSRAIDDLEENELVPDKKVLYQFSARGHELAQILLGMHLTNPKDAASAYYRSRPLLLTLGLEPEDAIASDMAKSGGYSNGRDIGVVCNYPGKNSPMVLPMAGDVGSQYTPAAGYAQAIQLLQRREDRHYKGAISVILGGDGSVATNGFWSALTMATTLSLPVLFFIEDNGYGISVESDFQTPGGNIANNLYSFKNLRIFNGDGTEPEECLSLITKATEFVRQKSKPALLRLTVPRLNGHSYQDNQAYKKSELVEKEKKNDPLSRLKSFLIPGILTEEKWEELKSSAEKRIKKTAEDAWNRSDPADDTLLQTFFDGSNIQNIGGLLNTGYEHPEPIYEPKPGKQRINIVESIRKTMAHELEINDRL